MVALCATCRVTYAGSLLDIRAQFRDQVDLQIVAFPQSGVARCPGVAELLDAAAIDGAGLIGGIDLLTLDGDLDGQFDTLFVITAWRGAGLDVHLHGPDPKGLLEATALAEGVQTHGVAGAAALGLDAYGVAVGKQADLVCVQAETLAAAVVGRPRRTMVVKRGEIVVRDGNWVVS